MIKIDVAATEAEPVSVAEILEHARIDTSVDDAYIGALISVARANAENKTHRQIRPATVTITEDRFKEFELVSPVRDSSIMAIQYVDSTGGVELLDSSVYELHDDSLASPAIVTTAYNQTWPTIREVKGAVTLAYLAGYTTSNPVPEPIKQWIRLTVTGMYENRTSVNDPTANAALGYQFLDGLLEPYVVHVVK